MNFYLSYGGGVVSEALRLWLINNKWPHEAVYVDHKDDWPETREFVRTVPNLTIIKADVQGFDNLYDYCVWKKIVPLTNSRFCTDKFKIRQLEKYFRQPAIVYIGFSIDERQRIKPPYNKKELFYHYPLVAAHMTRQNCIEYIKQKGGEVPMRSNCWFCPFQTPARWKLLKKKHPELYEKAKVLEAHSRRGLVLDKKLEHVTQETQGELFE